VHRDGVAQAKAYLCQSHAFRPASGRAASGLYR
jgi:hypothetical protein